MKFTIAATALCVSVRAPFAMGAGAGGTRGHRGSTARRTKKGSRKEDASHSSPLEPSLPGILPGMDRPKIILAQDIDYPPYAQLGAAEDDFPISGFGAEFATGLMDVCDIDVYTVQTQWSRCWQGDKIGEGLAQGEMHGCTTYTHASGVRNRYLEFSDAILEDNKAAGIPCVSMKTAIQSLMATRT